MLHSLSVYTCAAADMFESAYKFKWGIMHIFFMRPHTYAVRHICMQTGAKCGFCRQSAYDFKRIRQVLPPFAKKLRHKKCGVIKFYSAETNSKLKH